MKDDVMSGACGTHRKEDSCIHGLGRRQEGKRPREDVSVDEKVTLKWTYRCAMGKHELD
jgi:hypothetical protein